MAAWIKYLLVTFAVPISLFWGVYGIIAARREEKEEEKSKKSKENEGKGDSSGCMKDCIFLSCLWEFGFFISEFLGSLAGWICLYALLYRAMELKTALGIFDVFLGTAAIICITGFAHQFSKH